MSKRSRARPAWIMHDSTLEIVARRVAGETLADIRSVRKEMRAPGAVRGLVGERIRAALARAGIVAQTQGPNAMRE